MKSSIIESIKLTPCLTIIDTNRVYADEEAGVGDLAKIIENASMIVANSLQRIKDDMLDVIKASV